MATMKTDQTAGPSSIQLDLFEASGLDEEVSEVILGILGRHLQPSASELLKVIENELGLKARWHVKYIVKKLASDSKQPQACRQYLKSIIGDGSLDQALVGDAVPDEEFFSTIDTLFKTSIQYRSSSAFQEMVQFMARFKKYSPFNNMLVRLQNPSCQFYATEKDWRKRFQRRLKEDAYPMIILAPMHPVLMVYDLDQTEGTALPKELNEFAKFQGSWDSIWLERVIKNAGKYRIRIAFKPLSKTHGGFATFSWGTNEWKMRIVVHEGLNGASRLGVLCHELAHIFLGHLGADGDHWWPYRANMDRHCIEIEAEAVAYIVTTRLGLEGHSASYVSRYLQTGNNPIPEGVSIDLIAKTAGKIEKMVRESIPKPKAKAK